MKKSASMLLRVDPEEKAAFEMCAEISGITLSAWMRERLRACSVRELTEVNVRAPFLRVTKINEGVKE